jgi:hypothetical protein
MIEILYRLEVGFVATAKKTETALEHTVSDRVMTVPDMKIPAKPKLSAQG